MPIDEASGIWWAREDNVFGVYHELVVAHSTLDIATCCRDGIWQWSIRDHGDMLASGSAGSLIAAKRSCVQAMKRYYVKMLDILERIEDAEG